ncbi:hypothetical protein NA57DRAFT_81794 [Rhizodiscina lignyota]|uniref:Uncharacterized protein n=1 Tax=Rhizodiscina lignyota TaxID=1504668 RepID=A0A9P4M178_9PEZI|nr:hypothetical protein NA57DRAFT_81794 [Rhizodiscina lignyota]
MYLSVSPKSSPASPTLSIGFPSSMESIRSTTSHSAPSASKGSACAYPSWPTAESLRPFGSFATIPSSFISDAELFGDDEFGYDGEEVHAPYLEQPPPPPRQYAMPTQMAMPLLPIFAAPVKTEKKRRKSSRKQSNRAKPMTPISESPETPEFTNDTQRYHTHDTHCPSRQFNVNDFTSPHCIALHSRYTLLSLVDKGEVGTKFHAISYLEGATFLAPSSRTTERLSPSARKLHHLCSEPRDGNHGDLSLIFVWRSAALAVDVPHHGPRQQSQCTHGSPTGGAQPLGVEIANSSFSGPLSRPASHNHSHELALGLENLVAILKPYAHRIGMVSIRDAQAVRGRFEGLEAKESTGGYQDGLALFKRQMLMSGLFGRQSRVSDDRGWSVKVGAWID